MAIVHQVYAQIAGQEVKNVIVCENYEMANRLARCAYGQEALAVDCLQYPCSPGDLYVDGIFYRMDPDTGEKTRIEYVPTQEQQVVMLNGSLTDTQAALTEQYESDMNIQEAVTTMQLALTEIYEGKGV